VHEGRIGRDHPLPPARPLLARPSSCRRSASTAALAHLRRATTGAKGGFPRANYRFGSTQSTITYKIRAVVPQQKRLPYPPPQHSGACEVPRERASTTARTVPTEEGRDSEQEARDLELMPIKGNASETNPQSGGDRRINARKDEMRKLQNEGTRSRESLLGSRQVRDGLASLFISLSALAVLASTQVIVPHRRHCARRGDCEIAREGAVTPRKIARTR